MIHEWHTIYGYRVTAFFFTVFSVFRSFVLRLHHVRFKYVKNVTRDVSKTKITFQMLATFTAFVQSNHRSLNVTVLRLLNAKLFLAHAHKP